MLNFTLHDLTYLLTNKDSMYKIDLLEIRFGISWKNVFKTRRRIQDCLTDLKRINLIYKTKGKYWLNLFELHLLFQREQLYNELKKIEKELTLEYVVYENKIKNLSKEESKDYEAEF